MSDDPKNARSEIDALTRRFFALFTNRGGAQPDLDAIHDLFVPGGVIARTSGTSAEIWDLDSFIAPRRELLTSGVLTDFSERETDGRTEIAGGLAHRVSTYEKSGVRDGVAFAARGVKILQFVSTAAGWRILSVAWDDERPGFSVLDR